MAQLGRGDRSGRVVARAVEALQDLDISAHDLRQAVTCAEVPRAVPTRSAMRRAAEHLRVHALELQNSHTVSGVWGNEPYDIETRTEVEDMLALADSLDAVGVPAQAATCTQTATVGQGPHLRLESMPSSLVAYHRTWDVNYDRDIMHARVTPRNGGSPIHPAPEYFQYPFPIRGWVVLSQSLRAAFFPTTDLLIAGLIDKLLDRQNDEDSVTCQWYVNVDEEGHSMLMRDFTLYLVSTCQDGSRGGDEYRLVPITPERSYPSGIPD